MNIMTHTNVVTMNVPITAYVTFIVISFVACLSECGVAVNQKYVSYYRVMQLNV
jgi:hypothetical protein